MGALGKRHADVGQTRQLDRHSWVLQLLQAHRVRNDISADILSLLLSFALCKGPPCHDKQAAQEPQRQAMASRIKLYDAEHCWHTTLPLCLLPEEIFHLVHKFILFVLFVSLVRSTLCCGCKPAQQQRVQDALLAA